MGARNWSRAWKFPQQSMLAWYCESEPYIVQVTQFKNQEVQVVDDSRVAPFTCFRLWCRYIGSLEKSSHAYFTFCKDDALSERKCEPHKKSEILFYNDGFTEEGAHITILRVLIGEISGTVVQDASRCLHQLGLSIRSSHRLSHCAPIYPTHTLIASALHCTCRTINRLWLANAFTEGDVFAC